VRSRDIRLASTVCALAFGTLGLLALGARADSPIPLTSFSGVAEVTVSENGDSAQFVEFEFATFVRLTNDPHVGDPPVIVVASPSVLTFDFDFDEPLGSNDEFSAVLFSSGPGQGPFFGQLERFAVQSSQMGSGSFDLSPYVGQTLGLEFELLDKGGDNTRDSTVTVSNVRVPEPSLGLLFTTGLMGLLLLSRISAKWRPAGPRSRSLA